MAADPDMRRTPIAGNPDAAAGRHHHAAAERGGTNEQQGGNEQMAHETTHGTLRWGRVAMNDPDAERMTRAPRCDGDRSANGPRVRPWQVSRPPREIG